jgi:hypothetical protein
MKPVESEWARQSPYKRYFDFIAPKADRCRILQESIESLGLRSTVILAAGNRHIFLLPPGLRPPRTPGDVFPFKGQNPFMLVAHYDRAKGSPGANDNSIAVFHLLRAATLLAQKSMYQWIVVFTDKEEITAGQSFEEQGSYTLAVKIKQWGLEKARIFIFDSCGTGGTFILSTTTDHILQKSDKPSIRTVKEAAGSLRNHALETTHLLRLPEVLLAPTPFSDDVGFLRAGIAAQTITMLPAEEAARYESLLRSRPDFTDLLISGGIQTPTERRNLPETWRNLNSASDVPARLTPQFFDQVVRFAVELCR